MLKNKNTETKKKKKVNFKLCEFRPNINKKYSVLWEKQKMA